MALFNSKTNNDSRGHGILGQFAVDVIKWEPQTDEEASVIAHKFEAEDFPAGSQLIVHPSQVAVFINNLASGSSVTESGAPSQVAIFPGPCKVRLETGDSRFAPFRRIVHALTGDVSAYHSSVYFLNTTYLNDLNWGTHAPVVVVDPEEEINVHVRAFGLFGVHVEHSDTADGKKGVSDFLLKVVGTRTDFSKDNLVSYMRAKILEYVPDLLAKSIINRKIGVLKISAYLSEFSQDVYEKLIPHFDAFGLKLDSFSFHNINVPDEDLAAINEMKVKKKRDRLEAEGTAAKMDIESAARARMREREGYTYQQEQAYGVLHAAAENEASPGTFMGAGIGLGVGAGLGSAFGSGMSSVAQTAMEASQNKPVSNGSPEETVCPDCGTRLPDGAKFCLNCGKKLEAVFACPDCGTVLQKGAKFCYNCGKRLITQNVCPKCGAQIRAGSSFCTECGEKL